jgi:hypothetical protein
LAAPARRVAGAHCRGGTAPTRDDSTGCRDARSCGGRAAPGRRTGARLPCDRRIADDGSGARPRRSKPGMPRASPCSRAARAAALWSS